MVRVQFLKSNLRYVFLCLLMTGITSVAHGQTMLDGTLNPGANPGEDSLDVNLRIDDAEIFQLSIEFHDADYDDEGSLIINPGTAQEQTIPLFAGDTGADDMSHVIVFNLTSLGLDIQSAFNTGGGDNVLRFTRVVSNDEPTDTGYGVYESRIQAITQQQTKRYSTVYDIDVDAPISASQTYALDLYKRLVGVRVPIDHPTITQMANLIDAGDARAAASLATGEPGFLNLVIRDFAAKMSTRDQSINEPLNDFIAIFIGVARDNIDARRLLDGQFTYRAPVGSGLANEDPADDLLRTNDHYNELRGVANNGGSREASGTVYDFGAILQRQNSQQIFFDTNNSNQNPQNNSNDMRDNPDAAGLLTTRTWLAAHAVDGTNRRLVEFTVKQFACMEMEEWADATAPDTRVGRDIDRFPGGEGSKYLTTCKACHSVMDGFRGAFAKYDWETRPLYRANRVDYKYTHENGNRQRPHVVFPQGYIQTDNSWVNNARSPANISKFGWRGYVASGNGVRQFGTVIANSRAFSRCMAKKVYREICRRPTATFEKTMVETVAHSFENSGYSLKSLFEEIAIRPECLGVR